MFADCFLFDVCLSVFLFFCLSVSLYKANCPCIMDNFQLILQNFCSQLASLVLGEKMMQKNAVGDDIKKLRKECWPFKANILKSKLTVESKRVQYTL